MFYIKYKNITSILICYNKNCILRYVLNSQIQYFFMFELFMDNVFYFSIVTNSNKQTFSK